MPQIQNSANCTDVGTSMTRQFHEFFLSNFWRLFYVWPNSDAVAVAHVGGHVRSGNRTASLKPREMLVLRLLLLLSYTVLSSSLEVDKQAASEKKQLEGGLRTSDTIECMKNSRRKMALHSLPIIQTYLCSCISTRIRLD